MNKKTKVVQIKNMLHDSTLIYYNWRFLNYDPVSVLSKEIEDFIIQNVITKEMIQEIFPEDTFPPLLEEGTKLKTVSFYLNGKANRVDDYSVACFGEDVISIISESGAFVSIPLAHLLSYEVEKTW